MKITEWLTKLTTVSIKIWWKKNIYIEKKRDHSIDSLIDITSVNAFY